MQGPSDGLRNALSTKQPGIPRRLARHRDETWPPKGSAAKGPALMCPERRDLGPVLVPMLLLGA